ncbi:hypothetical protein SAMN02745131_01781 [Flavisolibacter ginsengisoli DSM 18119]|uniref:DUF983 domain-containing protein n=1 Tax=Flavisolibacter ginsengisoli DSM 18119 TaxID=1121884 RepID=A0A1M4YWC7_9BACT|nr:hypothetical protein SAMN02745131_01781 [Flavisolibacter ginsengisoli DSM 18119]
MCAIKKEVKPNFILSILQNKCPRCRRGKMYQSNNPYHLRSFMRMFDRCQVCGQPLDMEPGFYYGTNMVSYSLALLISVLSFILWWIIIGFSLHDNRFFWWIGFNAFLLLAMQPPLMRLSRTIWLAFFVPYSPNWNLGDIIESERINKEHMNNW